MATKEKPKKDYVENILSIAPAPAGMVMKFKGLNAAEQPIETSRFVACLALVDAGGTQVIRAIPLDEIVGEAIDAGEFEHVAI